MGEEGDKKTGAASFDTGELEYDLPEALIAQEPLAVRSAARMLVVDRETGGFEDRQVSDLPAFLSADDVLVLNDTRVLPAKFVLRRPRGGRVEGLFLEEGTGGQWEVLLKGAGRVAVGEVLTFEGGSGDWAARTVSRGQRGRWRIQVEPGAASAVALNQVGRAPLPPYIKRGKVADDRDEDDVRRYQTVYARREGAVAAPTAGLHFTEQMLEQLQAQGVGIEQVTLHVGYGTFAPVEVEDLADHAMHSEYYEIGVETCARLSARRRRGGRVAAVGTTSARVLETAWERTRWSGESKGFTDLFCYPPYAFRAVDVLLTNFHLPRSTLLALVMAFAGVGLIRRAYAHAVERAYRFYSYGDAMLIL